MDNFKEFQGRDLDECIDQSCRYFNCPREKLEIEIIQDAKSGIFGIVGARKAKIRARRARLPEAMAITPLEEKKEIRKEVKKESPVPENKIAEPELAEPETVLDPAKQNARKSLPATKGVDLPAPRKSAALPRRERGCENDKKAASHKKREMIAKRPSPREDPAIANLDLDDQEFSEDFQATPLEELDAVKLEKLTREVVAALLKPIAAREVVLTVDLSHVNIHVKVDWEGDAGLLIGRDGQTLAALQYLASRMISHGMNSALRIQLDIGDYRRRQEEKLCDLARTLAEKARRNGRSFSTRPLSSYHRRIIHVCLQGEPDVQTRSSGDGPLKRVLIFPKKTAGRQ